MEKQIEAEMAEMLEIIEKSREEWSNDVTDHTENEYIREGLLNEGYRKQEWINVEERLPEEDVRVLVWLKEDHRTTYTRIDTDRLFKGKWVRWGGSVTHWMPLPPLPKGERHDS